MGFSPKIFISITTYFFVLISTTSVSANTGTQLWKTFQNSSGYVYPDTDHAAAAGRNSNSKYSDKIFSRIVYENKNTVKYEYDGPTYPQEITPWEYIISFGAYPCIVANPDACPFVNDQPIIDFMKQNWPSTCNETTVEVLPPYATYYFSGYNGPKNEERLVYHRYEATQYIYQELTQECKPFIRFLNVRKLRRYECPDELLPDGAYFSPANYQDGCRSYAYPVLTVVGKPLKCTEGSATEGNPCSVNTGDKIANETDYDDGWLSFSRTYHSLGGIHSSKFSPNMGNKWTHNFSDHLVLSPYNSNYLYGYVSSSGYHEPLSNSSGVFVSSTNSKSKPRIEKTGNEWRLSRSGKLDYFDSEGRLIRRKVGSHTLTLTYIGNLLDKIEDESGRSLQFTYNDDHNISSIQRPDGLGINYIYDSNGNLTQVNYPDATTIIYHYEDTNFPEFLTGITDKNGNRSYYSYDPNTGQATTSTPIGGIKSKSFSYQNLKTIVTDSLNRTKEYTFDINNQHVLSITDVCDGCDDSVVTNTWYIDHLWQTNDNGQKTYYWNFDSSGRPGYKIDAYQSTEARRADFEYDSRFSYKITEQKEHSVISTTTSGACTEGTNCKITNSTYDDDGNLTSRTISGYKPDGTPISRTTTWTYNGPYGQLSQIDGPRTDVSDITTFEYYSDSPVEGNNRGRLKKITLANGIVQRDYIQYSATGKILSESRPNEEIITYTYYSGNDRVNTVTTTQAGIAQTTKFTYTNTGEVATITSAYGTAGASTTTYTYDAAKQLTQITDDQGNYITYTYDSEGNQTGESIYGSGGILKKSLTKTYDRFNRLNLNQTNFSTGDADFDVDGTIDAQMDGNNIETDYSYDSLRRLTSIIQDTGSLNIQTQYVYDVADRLVKVIDPETLETEYEYDDLGNLLSLDSPDTGLTTFTYDEAGNRTGMTDARGITVNYHYDVLNRLTLIDYPNDIDITYTYDENSNGQNGVGNLTTVTDQSGTTMYAYGARGNLESETHVQDGLTFSTDYSYNLRDELIQVVYPSGRSVDYTRNSLGQVIQITTTVDGDTQTIANSIDYLPFGPQNSLTFGNNVVQTKTYDSDYRLTDIVDGAIIDYAFSLDAVGNITARNSTVMGNETYQYDNINRLTQGVVASNTEGFTYDGVGNRLTRTLNGSSDNYGYGSSNHHLEQINSGSVNSFAHDAVGNTLTTNNYVFTYGDNNRLETIEDFSYNLLATYSYNSQGLRTKKVTGDTSYYTYDYNGQLISESDSSGNIIKEYYYLNGSPIAMSDANGLYYFHTDQLGTPKLLTNSSQTIVWSASHSPFGEATVNEDPDNNSTHVVMNIRFPGQYHDQETGLHYNWNRFYEPSIGRYITSDPIGLDGGVNTYGYALQNPVTIYDPSGLIAPGKIPNWGSKIGQPPPGPFGPVCGPKGKNLASWIPDAKFTEACKNHDTCYDCSGRSQVECDNVFCDEMIEACRSAYGGARFGIQQCMRIARLYCREVRKNGHEYYKGESECTDCI